jgi:hypothetical protein
MQREKQWYELSLDEILGDPQQNEWESFAREDDNRVQEAFEPIQKAIEEEASNHGMEHIKQTVWLSGGTLAIAATTLLTHPTITASENFLSLGMVIGFGVCLMITFAELWFGQQSLYFAHKTVLMPNTLMKAIRLYGASVARGETDSGERKNANALWDQTRMYGKKMDFYGSGSKRLGNIVFVIFELSMLALIIIIVQTANNNSSSESAKPSQQNSSSQSNP